MVYSDVLNRAAVEESAVPLDSLRKAFSSERGGIVYTARSAQNWEGSP